MAGRTYYIKTIHTYYACPALFGYEQSVYGNMYIYVCIYVCVCAGVCVCVCVCVLSGNIFKFIILK